MIWGRLLSVEYAGACHLVRAVFSMRFHAGNPYGLPLARNLSYRVSYDDSNEA